MLHRFYAVTLTSIYEVKGKDGEFGYASATKIAMKGESHIAVGEKLEKTAMISIGSCMQGFIPEGGGLTSQYVYEERNIERVNTFYHGGRTSSIVALFKTKKAALSCFNSDDLQPYDKRWLDSTKGVLDEIGNDHPSFSICHEGYGAVPDLYEGEVVIK